MERVAKAELEGMLQKVRDELAEDSKRIEGLEEELGRLQAEQHRRQSLAKALEAMLSPDEPPGEDMKLTQAILSVLAQRPAGLPTRSLATRALRLAPSKSKNPQRVAEVRVAQLVKEGRLTQAGPRIKLSPKEKRKGVAE